MQRTVALLKSTEGPSLSDSFDTALQSRLTDAAGKRIAARQSILARVALAWQVKTAPYTSRRIGLAVSAPLAAATMLFAALTMAPHTGGFLPPNGAESTDSFVRACVSQQHSYDAASPLGDLSAQNLAQSLDGSANIINVYLAQDSVPGPESAKDPAETLLSADTL